MQYARHIDNLCALGNLPAPIIRKHFALQIQPDHYPIVGTCLLRAIREVLGAEIATDAVIEAWGAAYWQLANILKGAEKAEYDRLADASGGWRGARQFRVIRKVAESQEITSFYLEPVDGGDVVKYLPGQYLGLRLVVNGQEVRRNYSLSQAANGKNLRISVKRQTGGVVSNHLHDKIAVGDVIDVFSPAGEFTLKTSASLVVLISGGVGITPTLAMAEAALKEGQRDVIFIHYARNGDVHAFRDQINTWIKTYPQLRTHVVYEQGTLVEGAWPTKLGRPEAAHLKEWLPEGRDCDVYFLGPKSFMAFVQKSLLAQGPPQDRLNFEFFGPTETLN